MYNSSLGARKGFTIVELLIVVVVIAILAAITIVAYNGIQNRAKASAAQSSAKQAYTKIQSYAIQNAETYPIDAATAGLQNDTNTSYQYQVNNTASPRTFCLTVIVQGVSYYVSSTSSSPTAGACAITNLATDPDATFYGVHANGAGWRNVRWFGQSGSAGSYTLVTGASDGPAGLTTYARKEWTSFTNAGGDLGFEHNQGPGTPISEGKKYTISSYIRSNRALNNVGIHLSWRDATNTTMTIELDPVVTLVPNTWTRLSNTVTAPAGAIGFYIISDVDSNVNVSAGLILEGTGLMVTEGETLYPFASGTSPGWTWNGTANNSTSTGPPL